MELLRTEKLNVGYGRKIIIENVEISIAAGEILTLIGPNGSGKSTLLRSIAAQLKPLGGSVYIGGQRQDKLSERELSRHMSVMFTERLQTEMMNCREVVESGRYPYTGTLGFLSVHDDQCVDESMKLMHTEELAECDFTQISDGQRQRVMLSRAICQEPEILILDEPTSFLDERHKLELLSMLKMLAKERNIAVIMSLHEIDLAQKISDTAVCVKNGRITICGTPEEVFTDENIRSLYDIANGSFSVLYGSRELEAVKGKPEVFVIGGAGSGIPIYRRFQRMNIPFAAGVIHENDIDHPIAKLLASELITERSYEPISAEKIESAKKIINGCKEVICPCENFGTMNIGNKQLAEYAAKLGILKKSPCNFP